MAATLILRSAQRVASLGVRSLRCPLQRTSYFGVTHSARSFSRSTPACADRLLSEDHEWVVMDGNVATIGISDHAQDQLGDIVYVECPEVGSVWEKGDAVATVESVKAVTEVFTPVSGKVVEINETLADEPGKVNKSCYDEGWLYKMELSEKGELDELMNQETYNKFLETLE